MSEKSLPKPTIMNIKPKVKTQVTLPKTYGIYFNPLYRQAENLRYLPLSSSLSPEISSQMNKTKPVTTPLYSQRDWQRKEDENAKKRLQMLSQERDLGMSNSMNNQRNMFWAEPSKPMKYKSVKLALNEYKTKTPQPMTPYQNAVLPLQKPQKPQPIVASLPSNMFEDTTASSSVGSTNDNPISVNTGNDIWTHVKDIGKSLGGGAVEAFGSGSEFVSDWFGVLSNIPILGYLEKLPQAGFRAISNEVGRIAESIYKTRSPETLKRVSTPLFADDAQLSQPSTWFTHGTTLLDVVHKAAPTVGQFIEQARLRL